jgi:pimeloyl-ACP methyl ester carboxylesterase
MRRNARFFILGVLFCMSCSRQAPDTLFRTSGFAEVNGTKLHYEAAGSGDAVVFIHGGFADLRQWDDQTAAFSKGHRVIRYDLRGYGKSALPDTNAPYSHHEDLKALLDFLGIRQAHVCGQSFGSAVAADFAVAHPERCLSYIPVGPYLFGWPSPLKQELNAVLAQVDSVYRRQGKKAAVDFTCEHPFFQMGKEAAQTFKRIGTDYSFWHYDNRDPFKPLNPPAREQIQDIRIPTLIVTADNDLPLCREIAGVLEGTIAGSRKAVIRGGGHDINVNMPLAFNQVVLDFLKRRR